MPFLASAAIVWIVGGVLLGVLYPGHPIVLGVVVAVAGLASTWLFNACYGFFEGSLEGRFLADRTMVVRRWCRSLDLLARLGADFQIPHIALNPCAGSKNNMLGVSGRTAPIYMVTI